MSKNIIYIGVIGLAIIAAALGYGIYQQKVTNQTAKPAPVTQRSQNAATPKPATSQPVTASAPSAEEENLVKNGPGVNASAADRLAYYKKLQQFAKDATTVEITNCKPSPLIAKVKENSAPYITNKDSVDHDLRLGPNPLKVPAKGTIAVKIGGIEQFTNFDCVGGSSGIWITQ